MDHNSRSSERMLRRAEIFVAIVAVIGVAIVLAGSDEANAAGRAARPLRRTAR